MRLIFLLLIVVPGLCLADSYEPNPSGISYSDNAQNDAFGVLRVSPPVTIFDTKRLYTKQSFFWTESAGGSGCTNTFDASGPGVTLTAGTVSGNFMVNQTKTYWNYQPGCSFLSMQSANFWGSTPNVIKDLGSFDNQNGVFWRVDSTGISCVIRSAGVDTLYPQSGWNIDKFDGSGPSRRVLNLAYANIYLVDYEWLGVGRVRFGMNTNGHTFYCHQVDNANNVTSAYMKTSNLPLRADITNTATLTSGAILTQYGAALKSEGGYAPRGIEAFETRGTQSVTASAGTLIPLMAIRLSSGFLRANLVPLSASLMFSTNSYVNVGLYLNPTITGSPNWVRASNGNSVVEFTTSGFVVTTTTAGCSNLYENMISTNSKDFTFNLDPFFFMGSDYTGTIPDVVVLTGLSTNGNVTYESAAMGWKEIY